MAISRQYVYVDAYGNLSIEPYSTTEKFNILELDNPVSFIRERLADIERIDRSQKDSIFPFRIFGDVTNNCNLRCNFCCNSDWSIASSRRMSMEVLEKYSTLTPLLYNGSHLHLSCRMEPFLQPRFMDMVAALPREVQQQSMFTSNLCVRPFPDSLLEQLASSGLAFFNISVDTLDWKLFEQLRVNGRASVFFDNLERLSSALRRADSPTSMRFITVALRQNMAEIPSLINRAARLFPVYEHEIRRPFGHTHMPDQEWSTASVMGDNEWANVRRLTMASDPPYRRILTDAEYMQFSDPRPLETGGFASDSEIFVGFDCSAK